MAFLLKTRCITGKLAPAFGEHREYDQLDGACADAKVIHEVMGYSVFVVDFATDDLVASFL